MCPQLSTQCTNCLPDCEPTVYSASLTQSRLRPCTTHNLNLSPFCDVGAMANSSLPQGWVDLIKEDYNGIVPDFLR